MNGPTDHNVSIILNDQDYRQKNDKFMQKIRLTNYSDNLQRRQISDASLKYFKVIGSLNSWKHTYKPPNSSYLFMLKYCLLINYVSDKLNITTKTNNNLCSNSNLTKYQAIVERDHNIFSENGTTLNSLSLINRPKIQSSSVILIKLIQRLRLRRNIVVDNTTPNSILFAPRQFQRSTRTPMIYSITFGYTTHNKSSTKSPRYPYIKSPAPAQTLIKPLILDSSLYILNQSAHQIPVAQDNPSQPDFNKVIAAQRATIFQKSAFPGSLRQYRLHMVKACFLVIVMVVISMSACRLIIRVFSRYVYDDREDRNEA